MVPDPIDMDRAHLLVGVSSHLTAIRVVVMGGYQNVFRRDRPLRWHRHDDDRMAEVGFAEHKLQNISRLYRVERHFVPKGAGALIIDEELIQVDHAGPCRARSFKLT